MIIMVGTIAMLSSGNMQGEQSASPSGHPDYVVLLHGMGRTSLSMKRMEQFLENHGYRVINVSYHSRRLTIEQLSENYLRPLLDQKITDPDAKVHFVTHSLGGIIVRQYLSSHTPKNLGRVVMLAPPNHGSEIIDCLKANPISRDFVGSSGRELGTDSDAVPNRLGPVHFECGIIAGDRSFNPFLASLLPNPNDGKVSVASAKVEGMSDFLVLHSTHTWLMWRERTLRQTLYFLEAGHFDHRD
jgi:triacylglycerol lipase